MEIIFNEHMVMPMAGNLVVEDKWLQKESFRVNFISAYPGETASHPCPFFTKDFSESSFKENSAIFFQASVPHSSFKTFSKSPYFCYSQHIHSVR